MGVSHLSDLQSSIDFIINSGSGYFAYEMEKRGFILNDGQVLELASGADHSSLSESERIKYNVMTYNFTGSELDLRIYNKLSPAQYKQLVNFLQRYKGLIDLIEIDFYQGRSLVFTGEYYSVTEVIGALQQLVKGNIPKKGYFSGIFRGGKHRVHRYRKKAIRSEKGYTFEEAQVYARSLPLDTDIRWVLGTRTGLWYPIKPDDRDYYVWGIPNNEFIEMTEDEALRNQNTYRVLHSSSTKRRLRRIGGRGNFDKWMSFFDYYKKRGEIDLIQEKAFKLGKEKGKEDSLGLKGALLNVLETTQEKDSKKLLSLAVQSIDNKAEYQQIKSRLLAEIQEKAPEFYNEEEILETLDKFWKGYFSGLSLTDPDWLEGLINKQSSVKKLSSIVRR